MIRPLAAWSAVFILAACTGAGARPAPVPDAQPAPGARLEVVPEASVERREDPLLPPARGTTTIVLVPGHGYLLGGDMLDLRGIEAQLAAIARENRFSDIRIVTGARSPVDQIGPLLDLCQRLGLVNVSLSRGP